MRGRKREILLAATLSAAIVGTIYAAVRCSVLTNQLEDAHEKIDQLRGRISGDGGSISDELDRMERRLWQIQREIQR